MEEMAEVTVKVETPEAVAEPPEPAVSSEPLALAEQTGESIGEIRSRLAHLEEMISALREDLLPVLEMQRQTLQAAEAAAILTEAQTERLEEHLSEETDPGQEAEMQETEAEAEQVQAPPEDAAPAGPESQPKRSLFGRLWTG